MHTLTAADFADTGQWRLLLKIGSTGLQAFLENTLHPDLEPQELCKVNWPLNKDMLKTNIEEAVYNNPRLLDDFATRIILYDSRTLFIPSQLAEECAGAEEELYQKVYVADEEDIMTDRDRDLTAAWSPAPGVKSFLSRTFPGARISCNLMEKVRSLRKEAEGVTLYAMARPGEADFIFLDGKNLISASTHEWSHPDDIAFMVANIPEVYGVQLNEIKIVVKGIAPQSPAWDYLAGKAREIENR